MIAVMSDAAAAFAAYLAKYPLLATEDEVWSWDSVPTPLRRATYLVDAAPPLALVTSVRAVVFRGDEVLVIREPGGDHYIIPGGRREAGQTIAATLRRELPEETDRGRRVRPGGAYSGRVGCRFGFSRRAGGAGHARRASFRVAAARRGPGAAGELSYRLRVTQEAISCRGHGDGGRSAHRPGC